MFTTPSLRGRRVLITGAARSIGALTAERLHERGARVALLGLEPDLLAEVAAGCGDAPWRECDVADREGMQTAVDELAAELGGLDIVIANAGIAAQMPIVGGDPTVFDQTLTVNAIGCFNTLHAAGPHISHRKGYALVVSSMAAVVHLPLMSAYSASKAAVEALGNTFRIEMRPTGARVGVAYFSELDTDMTTRGFATEAVDAMLGGGSFTRVTPVEVAIDVLERGIARRRRRIVVPRLLAPVLPIRMIAQRFIDVVARRNLRKGLEIARRERPGLTTEQPDRAGASGEAGTDGGETS